MHDNDGEVGTPECICDGYMFGDNCENYCVMDFHCNNLLANGTCDKYETGIDYCHCRNNFYGPQCEVGPFNCSGKKMENDALLTSFQRNSARQLLGHAKQFHRRMKKLNACVKRGSLEILAEIQIIVSINHVVTMAIVRTLMMGSTAR